PQRMLSTKARAERSLFEWIIERGLGLEEIAYRKGKRRDEFLQKEGAEDLRQRAHRCCDVHDCRGATGAARARAKAPSGWPTHCEEKGSDPGRNVPDSFDVDFHTSKIDGGFNGKSNCPPQSPDHL